MSDLINIRTQTLSVRACARTRTRAGAVIFVHSGAEGALKMCVRVHAYNTFLVRTGADVRRSAPHVRTSIFFIINQYKFSKKKKKKFWKIFLKKSARARGRAGAKIGVRVRAPHTIKMCAVCVRVRPKNRAH